MCAATGLIAGIISLGENASGGMEHSDTRVSRGDESFSEEEARAANSDETTGVGGKGCEAARGEGGRVG